jgi:DNA-binding response OmpR family regulator
MRVLVVEDEKALAGMIAKAIAESGLVADLAHDGEEGLRLGRAYNYDAVILDLLLPKLHGLSVLKELRRSKPTLPILVLTALDQTEDKIEGLDRGADDYLTKPFILAELLARLRALLRRGNEAVPSSVVQLGDLTVDLARHTVTRGTAAIKLTAREYAILVFFLSRRGVVLSRTDIGEHVIDREFEATSNVIEVSISGLRAKLGLPSLIHTVRGAGYRFDLPDAS